MNQTQTQISAPEFVARFPELLGHYQAALKKAEYLAALKRRRHQMHFTNLATDARRRYDAARGLAEAAFRQATAAEFQRQRESDMAARDVLNARLTEYLADLSASEGPILADLNMTLAEMDFDASVVRQSLVDLGLSSEQIQEQVAPLLERRQTTLAEIDRQRAPLRRAYQARVQAAYDEYNALVDANREAVVQFKDGPELALRRELSRLDGEFFTNSQSLERQRDDDDFALRAWERALKERRLGLLNGFLADGDSERFVSAVCALDDELAAALQEALAEAEAA